MQFVCTPARCAPLKVHKVQALGAAPTVGKAGVQEADGSRAQVHVGGRVRPRELVHHRLQSQPRYVSNVKLALRCHTPSEGDTAAQW